MNKIITLIESFLENLLIFQALRNFTIAVEFIDFVGDIVSIFILKSNLFWLQRIHNKKLETTQLLTCLNNSTIQLYKINQSSANDSDLNFRYSLTIDIPSADLGIALRSSLTVQELKNHSEPR